MNRAQRRAAARLRTKPQRRHADPGVAHTLLTIHRPFSDDEAAHVAIGARLAWHKLTTGAGTEGEFNIIATAANVALIRAESIDAIAVEVVQRAQAVYVCGVCGQTDYGETGGPGDTDCEQYCRSRIERALAIAHKWADPLLAALPHSRSARRQHHQIKLRALRTQKKPRIP